jgi:predicted phage baseplate assembly protein
VLPGSFVLIQNNNAGFSEPRRLLRQLVGAQAAPRTAYAISGKTTVLTTDQPWWGEAAGFNMNMASLRATLVYGQSEVLTLAEEPILDPVDTQQIELAGLFMELKSGRWIVLSGERADIDAVAGVNVAEIMMVSGLQHGFDPTLPGDKTHTTLVLATPPAFSYKRDTLSIFANVVKATHGATIVTAAGGATRSETLGSGDGTAVFQSFNLRQPPLTFVSAPTPSGVASTLQVTVNDITWHETPTFAGQGPKARVFVTQIADDGTTSVTFGDGVTGSRTPTGINNLNASYRQGIGTPGNVTAEQINLLLSRPLGVRSVINPLAASGGADREQRDAMRVNVPLAVGALDRLVSLQDYADFALTFAGIGKAAARKLSDGRRELVHLTVAGADDIPIDPTSDLFNNLLAALRLYGDPSLPVQLAVRELVTLVLSAKIQLQPDYQWESVVTQVRSAVFDTLGFVRRQLAEPAFLSPVIAAIQAVPGVAYVDVDAFGGVPERVAEPDGTRRLLTLSEISTAVQNIVQPPQGCNTSRRVTPQGVAQFVQVNAAALENGVIRPAQLALMSPDLPETLVINQIV